MISEHPTRSPIPGVVVCLGVAGLCWAVSLALPVLSALLVAIVLGVVLGNLRPSIGTQLHPGTAIAAKKLLRLGIVLLGLKVSLADIRGLGWPVIVLVVAIVGLGMVASYWASRWLGLEEDLSMLIAAGFSICGAAAVAAVDGVIRPAKEAVATAIGLVVLFGTSMIAVVPLVARATGMGEMPTALWAGGGTHEVAQVVAIGGIAGGGTLLATAVIVKLARVVMLAPVMVAVAVWQRHRHLPGDSAGATTRPPLIPLFVLGFLAAVLVRTLGMVPESALAVLGQLQTVLLAAAMFALGLGVNRSALRASGARALLVGVVATLAVNAVALGGALALG